jgi:flagellar biogenesis protein FliO
MVNRKPPSPSPGGGRKWLPLALIGAVAIVAGIVLPQMLGGMAPAEAPPVAEEQKGSLDYVPPTWPEAPDPRAMLTRLGVGTAVVLALCIVTLVVCRHWLRPKPDSSGGNGCMTLVETLSLGNRCLVHLVRVGNQQVLVGQDGGGLKSLVALPAAFDEALVEAQETPPVVRQPAVW